MQTIDLSLEARDKLAAKDLDYAFVIAGWPTIYAMRGDSNYSIPATGDLSTFSAIEKGLLQIPSGASSKVKARPEEGRMTIGQLDVSILDKVLLGKRSLTDLISRQAYLEGTSPGAITTMTGSMTRTSTTNIVVQSTSAFPSAGQVYIGQECINYSSKTATDFVIASGGRGYRLTAPSSHASGVKVYGFLPSVYRQVAFVFKGYRSLPLEKWARAAGGPITGDSKNGNFVRFELMAMTWETYRVGKAPVIDKSKVIDVGSLVNPNLPMDFTDIVINVNSITPGNLGNGHYVAAIGGEFWAIREALTYP